MSEPTTAAGRALLRNWNADLHPLSRTRRERDSRLGDAILAIEAEAVAEAVAEIRARFDFDLCHECDNAETARNALNTQEPDT